MFGHQGVIRLPPLNCAYLPELMDSVAHLAKLAFVEDCASGDVTAEVLALQERQAKARVLTREPIVMCGSAWVEPLLKAFHEQMPKLRLSVRATCEDGSSQPAHQVLFHLEGNMAGIVAFERTFLNFVQRAVGIATRTQAFVQAAAAASLDGSPPAILDTRKTQPGFRYLDKYAVLCGGGTNHRLHLGDMVLIKENHVARFGSVTKTLAHVGRHLDRDVAVQIEVRNLDELREALAANCPLIMLDNFTPEMVREACAMEKGHSQLEVSGGMTLNRLADYVFPNLDRISVGALTHSVTAPDLTLLIEEE